MGCFSKIDARGVFSLGAVDEGFDKVLIFCGIIWTLLGEYGVFDIFNDDLETCSLRCFGIPVSISGLALAGAGPFLFPHLVFVTHGDVIDLDTFF